MLKKCLLALAAACAALSVAYVEPVRADGMPRATPSRTVSTVRHVHRIRHIGYVRPDPYAYSYNRPAYYPHYNSAYWVPRRQMAGRFRYPMRIPEYYSSWGYPLSCRHRGYRHCGSVHRVPRGNPHHYYRRDVQLPRPPRILRRLVGAPI